MIFILICTLHITIVDLYLAHVGSREPMVRVEYVESPVLLEGVVVRWVEYDDHNDEDDDHDDNVNDDDDNHNDDDHDDHLSRGGQDCP